MEYTVNKLAKLSGVSCRTLRYYDSLGLLSPARTDPNGYRVYGPAEVDRLQQILFYRELGVSLGEIAGLMSSPGFDRRLTLERHLRALEAERARIDTLIKNVGRTLDTIKGEKAMTDREKFEGLKKGEIERNETAYGAEARAKYGDKAVDDMNKRIMGMDEKKWKSAEALQTELNDALRAAVADGDPAGEAAQKACDLHRRWLCLFWGEAKYTKEAHLCLAESYVADERFTEYYEKIAPACAKFLLSAMKVYCAK